VTLPGDRSFGTAYVLVVAGSDPDVVALYLYGARQFAALSTGRLTDRSANTIDFNMHRLGSPTSIIAMLLPHRIRLLRSADRSRLPCGRLSWLPDVKPTT
jgi:hypothetical protein